MKESAAQTQKKVTPIIERLRLAYPDVRCALDFSTPWELLVATILSAQCTDKRVNMVTPALFKRFSSVQSFASARAEEVEALIRSTGFYKNKTKNILGAARGIVEHHGGEVPRDMKELVALPGVGRKTANVILGNAYEIPGIAVDTHMIRLNYRLGITKHSDPVKIEYALMPLVPETEWTEYSHLMIHHGRSRCFARKPDCAGCEILSLCPRRGVTASTLARSSKSAEFKKAASYGK